MYKNQKLSTWMTLLAAIYTIWISPAGEQGAMERYGCGKLHKFLPVTYSIICGGKHVFRCTIFFCFFFFDNYLVSQRLHQQHRHLQPTLLMRPLDGRIGRNWTHLVVHPWLGSCSLHCLCIWKKNTRKNIVNFYVFWSSIIYIKLALILTKRLI